MLNLGSLNTPQRLAVEAIHGPVLILAGAGTGKTRVITFRIAHMIEKRIAPDHILGVTFTNKAAREMQQRVNQLIPKAKSRNQEEKPKRPTICTFHSLCVRILRQHIEKLGYKRNFVIYDESEQLGAVKKILSQISAKGEKTDPGAILGLLSRYKNGGERATIFADPSVAAMAEHVKKRYDSALRACNAVDFDDLILLTLRLFREHADALEDCRARYQYVMVDEYQDTNAAQFELVHLLTKAHRNLCVVGDDDQSIYGWRGAEIANLLDLEKHFPEVKIVKLEQNYRSTSTILNAANALIKNNTRRRLKHLWSEKGTGSRINLHAFTDDEEEARTIVEQIQFAKVTQRATWGQYAILFRTNQQSRPIETALRAGAVRYHLIGGQSFFDRREIKDFCAYLKTFINPDDDISLLRIANTPARGLSDVTMERLLAASHERSGSVYAAMKNPLVTSTFQARTRESIEALVEFIERTRAPLLLTPYAARPLQTWSESFLEETGYYRELQRSEKNQDVAENRIRNLRDLIATMDGRDAETLVATGTLAERLETFLENITLDSDRKEEEESAGDAVTLITMHSCKGLEFPHVYIIGLEDGLLPHTRSKTEGTMDEERRLFYVAVTRAMLTLTITHCGGRKKYGQLMPCQPSPFLKELPQDLVEDASAKAKRPVTSEAGKDMFEAIRRAIAG